MWAGVDGSFPGVSGGNAAAAEGVETFRASEGERGIGFDGEDGVAGDACTDWDAGILMAAAGAAGQRPAPTAPPPFSSTLELAELQAGLGTDDGELTLALRCCQQSGPGFRLSDLSRDSLD